MNNKMKNVGLVTMALLSVLVCCNAYSASTITWAAPSTSPILGHDGATGLTPGPNDTIGYLVQLIWDVDGDGPDPVDVSNAYGVSGDDQYVDYSFIGSVVGNVPGAFSTTYYNTNANGTAYYMRAWEAVSSESGTGKMPVYLAGSSLYYGNSSNYFVSASGGSAPGTETFALQTSFSTIEAVPEPATIALALAGIGLLVFRRFRKKD